MHSSLGDKSETPSQKKKKNEEEEAVKLILCLVPYKEYLRHIINTHHWIENDTLPEDGLVGIFSYGAVLDSFVTHELVTN